MESGGTGNRDLSTKGKKGMDGLDSEPEFDRLAKPKGVQSWRRVNMTATRHTEFFDELPVRVRSVTPPWQQMERARIKATKAFMQHPEWIGVKWALVWSGVSTEGAKKVFEAMTMRAFLTHAADRYRWVLSRRGQRIFGTMVPRNSEEWSHEQHAFYEAYVESIKNKRKPGEDDKVITQEEILSVEFTDELDDDVIEGTT